MEVATTPPGDQSDRSALAAGAALALPAWNLRWLTPGRCRFIFIALTVLGFVGHLRYLMNDCPIDLSGDEAQYWDWSRELDWSYYSKGPLVAWIIRGSTMIFGNTMWAVRLPALVFAAATSILAYGFTLKLFKSDRLALGAVLLNHIVPMFVAGSLLMTIDPPYFFCWGLATMFLAMAVLEEKRWAFIAAGVAVGFGVLAKYGMLLWPVGMVIFLGVERRGKNWLRTLWPWLTILIALLFLIPSIIWNMRHDWVTFKHVAHQTGATKQPAFFSGNFFEFIASQLIVLGPPLAVTMFGAVVYSLGRWRWVGRSIGRFRSRSLRHWARLTLGLIQQARHDPNRRKVLFLLCTSLPLLMICTLGSLRSKMQINWPAASYFSLMILTAYFLGTRLETVGSWKRWRGWFWGAVGFGVTMMPIVHNTDLVYPLVARYNQYRLDQARAAGISEPDKLEKAERVGIDIRTKDFTAKLKGWRELGQRLDRELKVPGLKNPFILCEDYMETAEAAFYTPGQPITYCAGAYTADPKRHTQYDIWPDRRLDQPELRGRDAIYVGYMDDQRRNDGTIVPGKLRAAFSSIEELPEEPIIRKGLKVRRFKLYRCIGFKGMTLGEGGF